MKYVLFISKITPVDVRELHIMSHRNGNRSLDDVLAVAMTGRAFMAEASVPRNESYRSFLPHGSTCCVTCFDCSQPWNPLTHAPEQLGGDVLGTRVTEEVSHFPPKLVNLIPYLRI